MTTSLADRAAALAKPNRAAPVQATEPAPQIPLPLSAEMPEINIPDAPEGGPEMVPVNIAWLRVRATVRSISKDGTYNASGTRYNFRGVDQALNAFGPATLLHGVSILPIDVDASYRDTKTAAGKSTRECTVLVTYRIVGPMGDHVDAKAAGESLDGGDKGSAKAQAVALRVLLLHGGLVPTGDPDPDSQNMERGEAQVRPPASYRDEILHAGTTRQRMAQIRNELRQLRMWSATVANELGQDEPLVELLDRVGRERFAPKPQQAPDADEPADATAGHWRDPETGEEIPNDVGVQPGEFGGES